MQDQLAATNMAVRAYQKLKEVEPEHELVLLMESDSPTGDDDFTNRFWDKEESWQSKPGSMVAMYVEAKYFVAVRTILKEKHGIDLQ